MASGPSPSVQFAPREHLLNALGHSIVHEAPLINRWWPRSPGEAQFDLVDAGFQPLRINSNSDKVVSFDHIENQSRLANAGECSSMAGLGAIFGKTQLISNAIMTGRDNAMEPKGQHRTVDCMSIQQLTACTVMHYMAMMMQSTPQIFKTSAVQVKPMVSPFPAASPVAMPIQSPCGCCAPRCSH